MHDVRQHLQDGRGRGARAPPHRPRHQARRVRRHPRPVGLGQDHAAQPHRRHRLAHQRLDRHRRRGHLAATNRAAHAVPPREGRLRLPVLQPDPDAHRQGERRLRPRAGRARRRRRPTSTAARCSRRSASASASTTSPRSSPAASSSASPWRARWPRTRADPRRRAHRQPRLPHRQARARGAARGQPRRRARRSSSSRTTSRWRAVADRVLHLRDGRIAESDVNEHPVDPEDVEW